MGCKSSSRGKRPIICYPSPAIRNRRPANLIDDSRPLYFIKNLNRLIVTQDKELRSISPFSRGADALAFTTGC